MWVRSTQPLSTPQFCNSTTATYQFISVRSLPETLPNRLKLAVVPVNPVARVELHNSLPEASTGSLTMQIEQSYSRFNVGRIVILRRHFMRWTHWTLAIVASMSAAQTLPAQELKPTRGGFDVVLPARSTGEELNNQANLWVFEVQFKSLRMIQVATTNPKTGKQELKPFHYLVYRAINRELPRRKDETDSRPINQFDAPPGEELFAPAFMLTTNDNSTSKAYKDVIAPEVQAAIAKREKLKLLSTVEATKPVPEATPETDVNAKGYDGVAIFRDVDPDADYYTIYMSGFSNGYKLVKGPVNYDDLRTLVAEKKLRINHELWNGKFNVEWRAAADFENLFDSNRVIRPGADQTQWYYSVSAEDADESTTIWRKTIMQKYWRPGDRFDQFETEIRSQGAPIWIYRPDDSKIELPNIKAAAK